MVKCCGLRYPAWMSQRRVCETSAGESGKARLRGSRACCTRSRMAGPGSVLGRCQPISRRREPSTEDGAMAAAPKANTITTTVRKAMSANISGSDMLEASSENSSLHLDPDNSANKKVSECLQRDASYD